MHDYSYKNTQLNSAERQHIKSANNDCMSRTANNDYMVVLVCNINALKKRYKKTNVCLNVHSNLVEIKAIKR